MKNEKDARPDKAQPINEEKVLSSLRHVFGVDVSSETVDLTPPSVQQETTQLSEHPFLSAHYE